MKLTSEQRQTVADNHGLIWAFINKEKLNEDESEWYGIVAESLCKAVRAHNADKGKLSTLFFRVAYNDMINEVNKNKDRDELEVIGVLDNLSLVSDFNIVDYVYDKLSIANLSDRMNKIANLVIDGYTQEEIASLLNVSKNTVRRDISNMKVKIMEDDRYAYIKNL